jgi:YVTN family beta-propeller protein
VVSNKVIGEIQVGQLPHGLASPASQRLLYVSNEGDNSLSVIDTRTDEVIRLHEGLGRRPNEIDVTSDGRLIYLPALQDGVYEVFDTEQEKVVARFATDGFPHNAVVSPDDRFVYFSAMDRGNTPANVLEERGYPSSLNQKIYVADTATQEIVATIDTGDAPRPIAVSPDGKYLYVNVDGLQGFLVLDLKQRKVAARVEYELTEKEAASPSRSHGLFATPNGREVWTCDVEHGVVYAFDVTSMPPRQVGRVETGVPAYWLTGTRDSRTLYVTSAPGDTITTIDIEARKVIGTIQLPKGSAPKRMLVVDVPI